MSYAVIVERLLGLYAWPEAAIPIQSLTVKKLRQYPAQGYRNIPERDRAWDYGRIRFFYDQLLAGHALDPIEIDNVCANGRIYPEPLVLDGHHRLAASQLARARTILASYGGRVDLRLYLTGRRRTCPSC